MTTTSLASAFACVALLTAAFLHPSARACAASPASTIGFSPTAPATGPSIKTDRGYMVAYETAIPGADVKFTMIPVPGGTFKLGSAEGEPNRQAIEGPRVEVEIAPFWIGKYEVTWREYEQYMALDKRAHTLDSIRQLAAFDDKTFGISNIAVRDKLKPLFDKVRADENLLATLPFEQQRTLSGLLLYAKKRDAVDAFLKKREYAALAAHVMRQPKLDGADAVTAPTTIYAQELTYQDVTDKRQPAVTMTQFAARQYTKWLSQLSGVMYRLPSEAEWEYACRAGTSTAYSFAPNAEQPDHKQLDDYAWHYGNSDERSHIVGQKKPNAWGLYDMHGNVAEWTLDEYVEDAYTKLAKQAAGKPLPAWTAVRWPQKSFPHVIRGGGWDCDADRCRSAARGRSYEFEWKAQDPDSPQSPWWFTEDPTRAVGMRIIRPLNPPSAADLRKCWDADSESLTSDLKHKIQVSQRGEVEIISPKLPELLKDIDKLNAVLSDIEQQHTKRHPW